MTRTSASRKPFIVVRGHVAPRKQRQAAPRAPQPVCVASCVDIQPLADDLARILSRCDGCFPRLLWGEVL